MKRLVTATVALGLLGSGVVACTPSNPYTCSAIAYSKAPLVGSKVSIEVDAAKGSKILASVKYPKSTKYVTGQVSGSLAMSFLKVDAGNTVGREVLVTVAVSKNGKSAACATGFTPVARPVTPPPVKPPVNPPPDPEPTTFTGVPRGSLTSPTAGDTWTRGQRIELRTDAQDASNPGFESGVQVVEWWLYSPTFGAQYPGNEENKIFLGESHMPVFGSKENGAWTATFVVPAGQTITVTRDGEAPGGLPGPRTYQLPAGTYNVQSHLQNNWWFKYYGEPGKTQMVPVKLVG